ncbi:hypothetical protein [Mycobacterium sp. NPDC006124]|uniref:hypothetical protein n=1 Tax=Mycobacterium sp. NPDC006124 TaxID=3156729 RepID=UPI0033A29BD1
MNSSRGRRREANAAVSSTSRNSPELDRLIEAQATLDHARRNAKWKRECKNLQSASHAVQVAALAAHDAGIGWAEIGDVLGIERAMPQPNAATVTPVPTPPPSIAPVLETVTELDPTRHRTHHVVTAAQHFFPEQRQWATS